MDEILSAIVESNPNLDWGRPNNSVRFIIDKAYDLTKLRKNLSLENVNIDSVNLSEEFVREFGDNFNPKIWRNLSWKYLLLEWMYDKHHKEMDADGISWRQPITEFLQKNYSNMLRPKVLEKRKLSLHIPAEGLKSFI